MFLLAVVAAFAIAATRGAGLRGLDGRIVGGENALIESYPYQVSVESRGKHSCGGSILSASFVLTAAHCLPAGSEPRQFAVRAGSSLRARGGSLHQVAQLIRHERYATSPQGVPLFDVALLRLQRPLPLDATRRPIELARGPTRPGAEAVVTGWGVTSAAGGSPAAQLQAVSLPLLERGLCDEAYRHLGGLPEGQICAARYGLGGKDACQGDSGGPMAVAGKLVGIVSWGNGCAKPFYPGVYTDVAHHYQWITEHAQLA